MVKRFYIYECENGFQKESNLKILNKKQREQNRQKGRFLTTEFFKRSFKSDKKNRPLCLILI